ncbi:Glutaredoxin-dependent peroxiredoxin [Heracleum sosnowskyi]|uniref:Glutaredoxin-dependent peroxiredoxin n=1 Tax=Heracleum sosnowskyi TaxID=360622 RepID=A0AAD8IR34_9APIA|nr:Glutaredoxin-dependent peroxiredoxin [Heracleum sosnowskyi]
MATITASATFTLSRLISSPKPSLLPLKSSLISSSSSFTSFPLKLKSSPKQPLKFNFSTVPKISATIAVGDTLPDSTFSFFDSAGELQTTTVSDLTKSKKTIFFAVPGAFTPTCSQKHLPGFVEKAAELKSKGVDTIACVSVNDAFVMKAWKADLKVGDEVLMLSDGNGNFTKAIGVELDLSDQPVGLGVRSRRYAMLVDDGIVKVLNLEEGGAFTSSSAEDMLKHL